MTLLLNERKNISNILNMIFKLELFFQWFFCSILDKGGEKRERESKSREKKKVVFCILDLKF